MGTSFHQRGRLEMAHKRSQIRASPSLPTYQELHWSRTTCFLPKTPWGELGEIETTWKPLLYKLWWLYFEVFLVAYVPSSSESPWFSCGDHPTYMGMGQPLTKVQGGGQGINFPLALVFGSGMEIWPKYPNRVDITTFEGAVTILLFLNLRDCEARAE